MLTGLSRFWFARTGAIVPNHLLSTDPADVPSDITDGDPDVVETLRGRMMLGRLAEVLPIECVVRGYLSGSGWTDYLSDGRRVRDPAARRPPRERPAAGPDLHPGHEGADGRARREHPVRERRDADRGRARGPGPRDVARAVRARRRGRASGPGSSSRTRSSSSALLPSGELLLIDEVMTPDSSRFWDADDLSSRPRAGELRQAVRPRLAAPAGLGPHRARPGAARSTSSPGPAPATSPPSSGSPAPASTAISQEDVIAR